MTWPCLRTMWGRDSSMAAAVRDRNSDESCPGCGTSKGGQSQSGYHLLDILIRWFLHKTS
jgi:hypothetical protein